MVILSLLFLFWVYVDNETKFDMIITSPLLMANEVSYYLAYRMNIPLVLYATVQGSFPAMSVATGQPHNTALQPFLFSKHR